MIVCGLDLSLRGTGICFLGPKLLTTHRVGIELNHKDPALKIEREKVERLIDLSNAITKYVAQYETDQVAIENYSFGKFGNSSSVTLLSELNGVVKTDLWRINSLVAKLYAATSARAKTLGKGCGRMKKPEVMKKILERIPSGFPSDDEADAFVIAAALYIDLHGLSTDAFWDARVWG